jgi:GntR family transcriptional regulator
MRSSGVPLYYQLAEALKARLEAGEWAPGERFLSEKEIGDEFEVSRTVVRPALTMLEDDGQLVRIKGRGTFVSPPKIVARVCGLTALLAHDLRSDTEIHVLAAHRGRTEPSVAKLLELSYLADAIDHVTTLAIAGGRPLAIRDSFIAADRLPRRIPGEQAHGVITAGSEALDITLGPRSTRIQTSFCSAFEGERLAIPPGSAVLLIRCVERLADGGPIEVARIVYRSDIVELICDAQAAG